MSDDLKRLRSEMASAGYDTKKMSAPSSPVPAPPGKEPHRHEWKAHPGPEPDYRKNGQMWHGVRAYVMCASCSARTWLSPEDYATREVDPAVAVPAPEDRPTLKTLLDQLEDAVDRLSVDYSTSISRENLEDIRQAELEVGGIHVAIEALFAEQSAEVSRLRSQVERMEADSERLDWMEKVGVRVISIGPTGQFAFWWYGVLGAYFDNLRDAIDNEVAARRLSQQGDTKE